MNKFGSPSGITLQYRVNGGEFEDYTIGNTITLTNVNDSVELYSDNGHFSSGSLNFYRFAMTGKVNATGNIMSLMGFSDNCTDYCFYNLFSDCTSLESAPALPATELTSYCYNSMFYGCTSLTTAPALPATTLADYCYSYMFEDCTSLTTAPELPATELTSDCYDSMFYGCTSLMVYSSSGEGHTNVWRIQTNGNATGRYTSQINVFRNTIGNYASASSIDFSTQKTFYTQNTPVA